MFWLTLFPLALDDPRTDFGPEAYDDLDILSGLNGAGSIPTGHRSSNLEPMRIPNDPAKTVLNFFPRAHRTNQVGIEVKKVDGELKKIPILHPMGSRHRGAYDGDKPKAKK